MTDLSKRSLIKLAALTAVASAALIGCGKKEEAAPAPAPAAAEAPKADPLKIAFAYVGPVGDGGWTFAHDNGRKAVEAEFGDKVVTSFVENVPESADADRVIRDLAGQGNKLIFGTTFGYMEPMLKVAPDFADVKFEHA
ncbi:MAG: BMP family ABC transporter substrate-binding protein, partial [Hydrogenophaga sp.]|nr:BMP family ABC transporter substrate-binding protein [Hydrogenophaga sp.]